MSKNQDVIIVECPRDAIQGIADFIPTDKKVSYLNKLIASELFDWIDFGSFVSAKAVPQLADTSEVLDQLQLHAKTKLLAIVVNEKGALQAAQSAKITYLGYPFSISETFQLRNTHVTIAESFERLKNIVDIAAAHAKQVVVYISMAFGNPYADLWNEELVLDWMAKIAALAVVEFSLADTTSEATVEQISSLFKRATARFPNLRIGVHLHSQEVKSMGKIEAAYLAGCRKFDVALLGYGGCPFAEDELVGNIATEKLWLYLDREGKDQLQDLALSFKSLIS